MVFRWEERGSKGEEGKRVGRGKLDEFRFFLSPWILTSVSSVYTGFCSQAYVHTKNYSYFGGEGGKTLLWGGFVKVRFTKLAI